MRRGRDDARHAGRPVRPLGPRRRRGRGHASHDRGQIRCTGLDLLAAGKTPAEAIDELLKDDIHREHRQLGIIDMQGRAAAFTGQEDGAYAGSRQGENYTVQGNLLVGREVIDTVADSFEATGSAERALADRLIAALEAGQRAGGDKRKGRMQSASLVVADEHQSGVADDHIVDLLQVAEHPEPVGELRRQYDAIHERLGHRTFAVIRGRDVVQLKRMLHRLKLLWPKRRIPVACRRARSRPLRCRNAAAVGRFAPSTNCRRPNQASVTRSAWSIKR